MGKNGKTIDFSWWLQLSKRQILSMEMEILYAHVTGSNSFRRNSQRLTTLVSQGTKPTRKQPASQHLDAFRNEFHPLPEGLSRNEQPPLAFLAPPPNHLWVFGLPPERLQSASSKMERS